MPLVLAGVEGPVRGDQVDGDQRPVQDDVGVPGPRRVPGRLAQPRRPCGEQRDRLLHVPPGSGRADPEPGREAGERLTFAQVDQDQEGLLPEVQLPSQRADQDPVAADDSGREVQGLTRQRQRSTVEKHASPW